MAAPWFCHGIAITLSQCCAKRVVHHKCRPWSGAKRSLRKDWRFRRVQGLALAQGLALDLVKLVHGLGLRGHRAWGGAIAHDNFEGYIYMLAQRSGASGTGPGSGEGPGAKKETQKKKETKKKKEWKRAMALPDSFLIGSRGAVSP